MKSKSKKNSYTSIAQFSEGLELMDLDKRIIYCNTFTPEFSSRFNRLVRYWNEEDAEKNISVLDRQPIVLYIDSYGGELNTVFSIVDTIKMSKTPVHTINSGTCKNGAFLVYLAGEQRYAYEDSLFILQLDEMTQIDNPFLSIYKTPIQDLILDKTNIPENELSKMKAIICLTDKAYQWRIVNNKDYLY